MARTTYQNDAQDSPAQVEVKMATAKVFETETMIRQVDGSDRDALAGS